MTDAERAIWFAVRDRRLGGFKVRRQVTIGRYIVDFLCVERDLIVELTVDSIGDIADGERSAELTMQGYRIVRFWNNDVLANTTGVLQTIHQQLLSSPSPARGRGPG